MADVTITYQGRTISEISESTTRALKTKGRFCTDDIVVAYQKSGMGVLLDYLNKMPLNDVNVVITKEGGMDFTLDVENQTLQVTWINGSSIGIRYKPYFLVPASVNSVHYKIVTGSRSYDTSQRFAPGIGVLPKAELPYMKNGVEYDAVTNADKFLAIAYTQQRNHEFEGVLDLSEIVDDTALCLFVAGWDVTFSEIYFA